MKNNFFLFILLCITAGYSQTDTEIDVLTTEMCKTLNENKSAPDSISVTFTFEKHLPAFIQKYNIDTEEKYNTAFDKIYVRFQKNCNLFVDIVKRNMNDQSDTEILQSAPAFKISKKDCKKLTQQKKFYYLEPDGSKVHVTIDNGKWSEKFEDGSFSILDFK